MWSDPEMASLDRIRENVNKDIAQGMRFGGFFYVLCATIVVAISPSLHTHPGIIFMVLFFCALTLARLFIFDRGFVSQNLITP